MATLDLGLTLALRPQQPDPFSTGLGKLVRINPIRSTSLSSPVPLYNSFEEGQRPFPLPQRSRAYDTAHLVSWSPALLLRERPQPQVPMLSSSEVKASQKIRVAADRFLRASQVLFDLKERITDISAPPLPTETPQRKGFQFKQFQTT